MKINYSAVLLVICTFLCLTSFAQQKTGQIYFIRSLNYVGSAVPFNVYIDDVLVCKLKNNKYSVHDIMAGTHSVSVRNTGLGNRHKSRAIDIKVEEGKINYLTVVNGKNIYLQEVVPSSAEELLKKVVQADNCPAKQ